MQMYIKCMQMYTNVYKCIEMYRNVCKCTQMYRNVCKCTKRYENVCNCMHLYANVCKCMQMYANVCKCISLRTKQDPTREHVSQYCFADLRIATSRQSNVILAYTCAGSGLDLGINRSFDASLPVFTSNEVLLFPFCWS